MLKACAAIDIGASSGRVILGIFEGKNISVKEMYRFKNNMAEINQHYYWDIDNLFNEILKGLIKLSNQDIPVQSIGIDTWAVDYILLDDRNARVAPVYAYRDHRTDSAMGKLFSLINQEKIYEKTGIQFQQFNTIYQLYEHVKKDTEIVNRAKVFLMIPDYLNFLLSGEKAVEFTNATTTQLLNIHKLNWDAELINIIGLKSESFPRIVKAGTILGSLTEAMQKETGFNALKIIAPATHDTGSAVAAVPAVDENFAYISSGTWSLMGIESSVPISTEKALKYNFTNEGGVFDTYRVLKNIMGLWLIQEVERLYNSKYNFAQLVALAEKSGPFKCLINPNDSRFLNPKNMILEIKDYCAETGQVVPETPGEVARCIFESLAFQYKEVLIQLGEIQEKEINKIHIIGGGVQNKFLNQLCANFTQCEVYAGPIEATALGNLMMQFIALGEIENLKEARKVILNSFEVEKYVPEHNINIEENWNKFKALI